MMKLLVYPKDKNPYQSLLYGNMPNVRITYGVRLPIVGSIPIIFQALFLRLLGYKIVHIHWPQFRISPFIPGAKYLSFLLYIFTVWLLSTLGYKIVWTIHNVLPHETDTSNDLAAGQYLANRAAVKIVHSSHALIEMKSADFSTDNTVVIPHGNYDGVYANNYTRFEARSHLNLKTSDKVILFFGSIRPYKGVENLLRAFESTNHNSSVKLIIAGKSNDQTLSKYILDAAARNENIVFYDQYIADQDVSCYFTAADVVCLPFNAVTTSGSALLALTYGKPLIAPKVGAITDFPSELGILYDPKNKQALATALSTIFNNQSMLDQMSAASRTYATTLSWTDISEATRTTYSRLLSPEERSQ